MSRALYQRSLVNSVSGEALSNASVAVYEPNTTTPIADTIYADDSGGTTLSNPLTADARGLVRFFLASAKRVDFGVTAAGMSPLTVQDEPVQDDPANVAHKTGVETLTQKTLSSPVINNPAIDAGSWTNPNIVDVIIQDRLRLRNGAAGPIVYDMTPSLIDSIIREIVTTGHATDPTFTLRNTNSGGTLLSGKNHAGTEMMRVRNYTHPLDGDVLALDFLPGGGQRFSLFSSVGLDMYKSDAVEDQVMVQMVYDNNYVGAATPDSATAAIIYRQMAGNAYARALETDMLAVAGSNAWPKVNIEASIEASYAGNGIDATVGFSLKNNGTLWGVPTPQRADTALLVGGDNQGFTNLIHYRDTIGAGAGLLYKVDQNGDVYSGDQFPRANNTFLLGTPTTGEWLAAYVKQYVSTIGTGSSLHLELGSGSGTGISAPAASAIGFKNNGAEAIRITADGLLDFRDPSSAHIKSLGGGTVATLGGAGGSGPSASGQAAWLKALWLGTPIFFAIWQ